MTRPQNYPIVLSFTYIFLTQWVTLSFGGGFIISPPGKEKDTVGKLRLQSGPDDGDILLRACNGKKKCYSIQFSFAICLDMLLLMILPGAPPVSMSFSLRMAPADLLPLEMLAAMWGKDLGGPAEVVFQLLFF